MVGDTDLARLGAPDADEAGRQDGILRGGLRPSGMPSHEQRGRPPEEPAVPTDGRGPGSARPSGLVRVAFAGLGLAAELPAVRAAGSVPSGFREPGPSAQ